jgi:formylglycine-generating enzyme required for sulfatase activity
VAENPRGKSAAATATASLEHDAQVQATPGANVESQTRDLKSEIPPPAVAPLDAITAKAIQARWAKHLEVPLVSTNSIGMKLVLIPPGEFMMGSPKELIEEELKAHAGDQWWVDHFPGEGPKHQVRITKAFYLGVTEVTQGEYEKVMGSNPSEFSATGKGKDKVGGLDTKRFPVECVSWDDAVEFCQRLSERSGEKAAKRRYGLPTEAQWEYACRAGSQSRWSFGDDVAKLGEYGWFNGNSGGMSHPVGQKQPNNWGLCDMYGNVWQWCQDWYDKGYYTNSPVDDPGGPPGGSGRVHRGGGWNLVAGYCRSACRDNRASEGRGSDLGFRVSQVLADE